MTYSHSSPNRKSSISNRVSKAIALSTSVIAMVFLMSVVVLAWTEPPQPPPGGNVPAPINIGTAAQTKAGDLILEQKLEFKETDSDHVWFYEGTPDNDNKVDLRIMLTDDRSDNEKFSIWDRYWRDGSIREDHYFTAAGNAWHRGDLTVGEGIVLGGVRKTNWPSVSETDTLDTVSDRGRETNQVLRFPKFEDYNDIGYYVDPASTNRMNYVYANRLRADSINLDGDELRFYRSTDSIIRKTDAYLELHGSANGNSRIWLEDGADRIYIGDGNTDLRLRGTVQEVDDLYAYRMFDRNNTGYYVDPNSTSRMYRNNINQVYAYNWMYSPILYDTNDSNYRLDPNGTSRLNSVYVNYLRSYGNLVVGGKVGIGTTSPGSMLHVTGGALLNAIAVGDDPYGGVTWPYETIQLYPGHNLRFYFGSTQRARLMNNGDLYIAGDYYCRGVDVAEKTQGVEPLFPGEVVSLDEEKEGKLRRSRGTYERGVAGVISTNPGLVLGESIEEPGGDKDTVEIDGVNLALAGRVPVRVTTENGPISVGDPLVTSSNPGYAMRGDEDKVSQMFGVVLGKAMESLETGEGEILVLIALR